MNFFLDYVLPIGAFFLGLIAICVTGFWAVLWGSEGKPVKATVSGVICFLLFVVLIAWVSYDLDQSIAEWTS